MANAMPSVFKSAVNIETSYTTALALVIAHLAIVRSTRFMMEAPRTNAAQRNHTFQPPDSHSGSLDKV